MEPWLLCATGSALLSGLSAFLIKVGTERKYDTSTFLFVMALTSGIAAFLHWVVIGADLTAWKVTVVFGVAFAVTYYITLASRMQALHYVHTTIYFPLYKTIGPICVTAGSLFYYGDTLSVFESIGIILGIAIPLLLITRAEDKRQTNLRKGLVLIGIGAIATSFAAFVGKSVFDRDLNFTFYLLCAFGLQALFAGLQIHMKSKKKKKKITKEFLAISGVAGIAQYVGSFLFITALSGNLAVVFTINAFSIIVTIVLAILIYKEHIDLRKSLVISLSVLSMIFFAL